MKRNSRRAVAPFCLGAIALMLVACGKDSSKGSPQISSVQEEVESTGLTYRANLKPLNNRITENSIGETIWSVRDGMYRVQVNMTNTPANLEHFQAIHEGATCPDERSDVNGDGVIDASELNAVSGKILIALDSNLSSNKYEDFAGSRANEFGNYTYWQEVGLGALGSFNPTQKTIVVYGIDSNYSLPETVSALDGNRNRYIPISCGVIGSVNPQKVY